ncbi:MAG TPA: hypothetical protein VH157_07680 [Bryobacteraceae bacterium]|jgi:hypothetical protein|nr:hypothetical protein [Bryobacteraceae bacterium]
MEGNGRLHPGISMHKLPVSGGAVGLLFAAGSMLVFLIGVPSVRVFFLAAIPLGLGFAFALRFFHKRHAAFPQEFLKLNR